MLSIRLQLLTVIPRCRHCTRSAAHKTDALGLAILTHVFQAVANYTYAIMFSPLRLLRPFRFTAPSGNLRANSVHFRTPLASPWLQAPQNGYRSYIQFPGGRRPMYTRFGRSGDFRYRLMNDP